jgi:hypothetical protein
MPREEKQRQAHHSVAQLITSLTFTEDAWRAILPLYVTRIQQ